MDRATFLAAGAALVAQSAVGSNNGFIAPFPGDASGVGWRIYDRSPFYSLNAYEVMPAASIIKVVILDAVCYRIEHHQASWTDVIRIDGPLIVDASPIFGSARVGQRASIASLAAAMIEESDNTAANVLAEYVSFASVNAAARRRGLNSTHLRRHFMDFSARKHGIDNTTTAHDMANLLVQLAREARSSASPASNAARHIVGLMLKQTDRETIPAAITRSVLIANKTGELDDVRHDIAIVDPFGRHPYVNVVMSCRLRDRTIAFKDLVRMAAKIDAASDSRHRVGR